MHELDKSHTSAHICEAFQSILSLWEINQNQINAIVTDSGIVSSNL